MKFSLLATILLAATSVTGSRITRRKMVLRKGPACSVENVGEGMCKSTSEPCAGGAYYRGEGTMGVCSGRDDIQCCIVGGTGTTPERAVSTPPPSGGNLPGLNSVQSGHARAILGEVQSAGVGKQGCLAAFATALVESSVYVYANNAVPASLNYPHDKIGSDHDSIGIFQQRASIYTNIAADMDPAQSAGQFFKVMEGISGWQTMDVGTLCQKVQKSAYPTRYSQQVGAATNICSAGGFS